MPAGGGRSRAFFFSSRRRHTRSKRDWSSDVCSSDLSFSQQRRTLMSQSTTEPSQDPKKGVEEQQPALSDNGNVKVESKVEVNGRRARSEERRVGKECGWGRAPEE